MNNLNKKGFTLVELVIVIAVIAILAAVLIPTFSGAIEKANQSAVLQAARSAYEEALTIDLADGRLDNYEGTKSGTLDDAKVVSTQLTNGNHTVTIDVVDGSSDYSSFTYLDLNKEYTATYSGNEWSVAKNQ